MNEDYVSFFRMKRKQESRRKSQGTCFSDSSPSRQVLTPKINLPTKAVKLSVMKRKMNKHLERLYPEKKMNEDIDEDLGN